MSKNFLCNAKLSFVIWTLSFDIRTIMVAATLRCESSLINIVLNLFVIASAPHAPVTTPWLSIPTVAFGVIALRVDRVTGGQEEILTSPSEAC